MTEALPDLPPLNLNHTQANFDVPQWRAQIEADIDDLLQQGHSVRATILYRSNAIDHLLTQLFNHFDMPDDLSLMALGGYCRQEMLPYSDVDIMFLSEKPLSASANKKVEKYIATLWDIGLEPGISVRSFADCIEQASDLTVVTCLLESRRITGNPEIAMMPKKIASESWTDKAFFEAKIEEQRQRYIKHNHTEYNLEPDIKNAPGGLRDIHHIGWICQRYFRIHKLSDLVHQSFMTNAEYDELVDAEDFLLTIRHYLHRITGRDENRLLFDFQRKIAKHMGYAEESQLPPNAHPNAPIEALMRVYYRKAMRISTLSEMLIDYYYESLIQPRLPDDEKPTITIIDDDFEIIGTHIASRHRQVFSKNPSNLLRLFGLMAEYNVSKVRAKTLRLIKANTTLIDDDFRQQPENKALFMRIIKNPNFLFHRLRKMKRYGVLGSYLPAFEKVIGLMQYDLFHRYTVDAHTLFLTRILHRFTDAKYADTFDVVGGIYERMERKELIHLAAIFHDIAKGRGGDHSELGADDAYIFCKTHGLSENDANLVSWLVQYHLLMSLTAQKRDISDPEVVRQFAEKVGDLVHLNHLYVLTVADMNATNSDLWNSWRATLMKQLYKSTRAMLRAGLDVSFDREDLIEMTKAKTRALFNKQDNPALIEEIWSELGDEYFIREVPNDIIWHTRAILAHGNQNAPLILVREHQEVALDAIQVFIYTQNKPNLFATTVNVFNQMNLDVQDARIITATRNFALDTYVLLDRQGTFLEDNHCESRLIDTIQHALKNDQAPKIISKRMPRQLKHFNVPTKVRTFIDDDKQTHHLVIEALDEPGLLARIACIFLQHDIVVHYARITTLGESAEDAFTISDQDNHLLTDDKINALKVALIDSLDGK